MQGIAPPTPPGFTSLRPQQRQAHTSVPIPVSPEQSAPALKNRCLSSSSSSSAASPPVSHKTPPVYSKGLNAIPLTTLIQEGSKCPTVTAGDISIEVMHDFEKAAWKFFNHKDIGDDKQVSKILNCFNAHRIADWVEVDRD